MAMERFLDLDIGEIVIIARKTERERGDVFCRNCVHDGFLYIDKGKGSFTEEGGNTYPVHDGSLILLRRGDSYRFLTEAGCSYITSVYTVLRDEGESLSLLPRVVRVDGHITAILAHLQREWEAHRPESYMRSKLLLLSLYTELLTADSHLRDPAVLRILEFINENFRRPFTGEELAAVSSLSLSYLRQRFRKEMGMSITEYRDTLRIRAACEMLRSHLFSPKEAAHELGYTDVHHFTKAFAAKVGIPPARYAAGTAEKAPVSY